MAATATPSRFSQMLRCTGERAPAAPHTHDALTDVNGSAVMYAFGRRLHHHFSLTATLTLPKIRENRGVFYADWILLEPLGSGKEQFALPFVQINLMRWSRYHYRPELAYTWAGRDGKLIYADSSIFLDDRVAHTFGIAVDGPRLSMSLDRRQVCWARTADFFDFRRPLYYQLGDEVARYGDRIGGTVQDIRLQSDEQSAPRPYSVTCMYYGRGLAWRQTFPGTYRGEGVLDKSKPSGSTGSTPNSHCVVPHLNR